MPPVTERGGVRFDEKTPKNFRLIKHIDTVLNSALSQDQLKSLRDVKDVMAQDAKALGGDYIANFTYGQKTGGLLQVIWSVDNTLWFGSGDVGILTEEDR